MNDQVRDELAGLKLTQKELRRFITKAEAGGMNRTFGCVLFSLAQFRGINDVDFMARQRQRLMGAVVHATPLEEWFFGVGFLQTPESNPVLAEFVDWCRSQLTQPGPVATMHRLTRPKIRAWAESQPEGTTWRYLDNENCLLGSYLRSLGWHDYGVGGSDVRLGGHYYAIPAKVRRALQEVYRVTGNTMTREVVLEVFACQK